MIKQFSSIWPIESTLEGSTTPGQSGPGNDGNEAIFHIPQSSIRMFSVISRTLVGLGGVLPHSRDEGGVFCSLNRLGPHIKSCSLWFASYFLSWKFTKKKKRFEGVDDVKRIKATKVHTESKEWFQKCFDQ